MFCLAHRAMLFAPAEDAFGHRPARLRHAVAFVPRGASVDGALAALAGRGDAVVQVNTSPFCSRRRSGPRSGRRAKAPRTSDTRDCSPIAPSAGVPTGCRRTPGAATRSVTVPAESRDGLRSRRACPGYGSARPVHRAQAPGSSSADGSPAPAPRVRCTKTARPDPQMRPACQPPSIRDRKLNHDTLAMARVFQQTANRDREAQPCLVSHGVTPAASGQLVQYRWHGNRLRGAAPRPPDHTRCARATLSLLARCAERLESQLFAGAKWTPRAGRSSHAYVEKVRPSGEIGYAAANSFPLAGSDLISKGR